MAMRSIATESITGDPPPPTLPPVKAEPDSSTPTPQPPETTTTLVKEEPQQLAITNNLPTESFEDQQFLQPHFINSVSELRNLSSALSAFQRRYDELQEHLDFILTSIDTKLPQRLTTDLWPPLPMAVVPFTKTPSSDNAETAIVELAKSDQAAGNNQSSQSEIESLCKTMCSRSLRKYIVTHLSDVAKLREEVPAALKVARNPAKLVLDCFGRFFLQGIKAYTKDSPMIPAREASVLILEFFLLMGCNTNEIQAEVKEEAELSAVAWRKRLISEGGLAKACEVDGRGLLLLIGCFGIPTAFKSEDVGDLIRASNAMEISDALRRSYVLLARIPGNKIPVIENLGATEDQFDTIDLSDNEIVKLENFPYLGRLGTLIVNNNRITRINPNIGEFLPKLHTLVLTNNRLTNLVEIDPLASLPKLQFLSLLDNNITKKPNYRLYVIHKLKSLRLLDFKKVKHEERIEAQNLFSSQEAEEQAKKESTKTFIPGEAPSTPEVPKEEQAPKTVAPTPEQIIAIKAAIVNSQTLEEVARLEKALKSGQLPADLKIGENDAMMNTEAAKEDKMVTDEENEANDGPRDTEPEQKNNESADMEQE